MVLRFDWIELASYMIPGCMGFLHIFCLLVLRDITPFFFLIHVVFALLDIYASDYTKNHSENE